jgi:hypothetical protein
MSGETFAGGCQCGAVRFAVDGPLGRASICHCRMCQKATGGLFGPFVGGRNFRWTRGSPAHFQSSDKVRRGFCAECGTPLSFEFGARVELSIGAFDEPSAIRPTMQLHVESRMPWFGDLEGLKAIPVSETPLKGDVVSRQHPDHDTELWPPGR